MYIEIMDEKPQPKTSELARRHNLTSKTACNFKQKVILEFGFMELESKRIIFIFYSIFLHLSIEVEFLFFKNL